MAEVKKDEPVIDEPVIESVIDEPVIEIVRDGNELVTVINNTNTLINTSQGGIMPGMTGKAILAEIHQWPGKIEEVV